MPVDDIIFEALFQQAVVENLDKKIKEAALESMFVFSNRHERRMKKLFVRERKKEVVVVITLLSRRIAIALMVFITLASMILMTMPSVRAVVSDTIIEWFDKFTKFISPHSGEHIIKDISPSYLPGGFIETSRQSENDISVMNFENESRVLISLMYMPIDNSTSVNNEDSNYSIETYDGVEYFIFNDTGDNNNSVIWNKYGYRFVLQSKVSTGELLQIAQSI